MHSPKTIGFTGAQARVGTTTTALACAVSAARYRSANVLLVDANVRHPDLHNRCGVTQAPGLFEAIDSNVEVGDVLQRTSEENLQLLSLGTRTARPIVTLAEPFSELLKVLRFDYDLVLFDVCSADVYDSSLRLLSTLDSVVLVMSPAREQSLAARSKELLLRLKAPLDGVVIGRSEH